MTDRNYQVAYGEGVTWTVVKADDASGNYLTRAEAAQRVVDHMDGIISEARTARRAASRILSAEARKLRHDP